MKDKLIQILNETGHYTNVSAERILKEFRCSNCQHYADITRGEDTRRLCGSDQMPVIFTDPDFFCSNFEAR